MYSSLLDINDDKIICYKNNKQIPELYLIDTLNLKVVLIIYIYNNINIIKFCNMEWHEIQSHDAVIICLLVVQDFVSFRKKKQKKMKTLYFHQIF